MWRAYSIIDFVFCEERKFPYSYFNKFKSFHLWAERQLSCGNFNAKQ